MAEVKSKYVDQRPPMVGGKYDLKTLTTKLLDVVFMRGFQKGWIVGFAAVFLGLLMMANTVAYLVLKGVGIWGNSSPVFWAFDIINFVWWIGIGHAGTLISAILLLLRQQWRNSINRFAEAMTLFAVACAAMFPALHTGRPWVDYWLFPIPNTMGMWQNFRSPLMWDVFAVNTYATVSLLFWFMGLIPDFATLRDSAKQHWQKFLFGMLAMGWRGDARHWSRYESAYLLLAGLSTPLVLSVHTIVSFDFSTGIVPGWHATIFPPYFVAGAVFSGFAMVATLSIPLRYIYNLQDFITERHLDNMGKVMELMAPVSAAYADSAPALLDTVRNTNTISSSIVDEQKNLDTFLVSLSGLADTGNDVIGTNRPALSKALKLMVPTTDLLNEYAPGLQCTLKGAQYVMDQPPQLDPGVIVEIGRAHV